MNGQLAELANHISRLQPGAGGGRIAVDAGNDITSIDFEDKSQIVRRWIAPNTIAVPQVAFSQVGVFHLFYLMTVHTAATLAALRKIANVQRIGFVRCSVRFALMRAQCRLHGVSQPGQRQPRFGVPGVATSITAVNMLIGIQEEHHHGHIVIEFKQIQIDAGNLGPPDEDEPICEVLYLFKTNNLLVKLETITSRDAAKDNH